MATEDLEQMTATFWLKFDVPFLLTDARSCVNESVTWLLTETDDRTQGGYLAGTPDGSAVLFLSSPPLTFSQQFKDPSLRTIESVHDHDSLNDCSKDGANCNRRVCARWTVATFQLVTASSDTTEYDTDFC